MHTYELILMLKSFDLDSLSKIYQQPNWEACRSEIVQTLRSVSIFQRASRLQFNQDFLLYQQISQVFANDYPVVSYGNSLLLLH